MLFIKYSTRWIEKAQNWWMKFFKGGKKMKWHIFLLSNKLKMVTLSHYCQAASVWFSLKSQVQDQHAFGVRSKTVHVWLVLPRARTMTVSCHTLKKRFPPPSKYCRSDEGAGEHGRLLVAVPSVRQQKHFLGGIPNTDSQLGVEMTKLLYPSWTPPWSSSAAGTLGHSWKVKLNWF